MKPKMKKKEDTIYSALGIDREWHESNGDGLIQEIGNNQTVSDTMEDAIARIRVTEFGEGNYGGNSDYEKKLFYSGFQLARILGEKIEDAKRRETFDALLDVLKKAPIGGSGSRTRPKNN